MQYQVPQFIEAEDKIVGPLTIRQFLYLAIAFMVDFILFFVLQMWLWFIIATLVSGFVIALAFIKINGRPLSKILLAAFNYFWRPHLYAWQKGNKTDQGQATDLNDLELQLKTSTQPISKREKWFRPSILARLHPSKEMFELFRKATGDREMARRVDYR